METHTYSTEIATARKAYQDALQAKRDAMPADIDRCIEEQIREIVHRDLHYPNLIATGVLTVDDAATQTARLLETVEHLEAYRTPSLFKE